MLDGLDPGKMTGRQIAKKLAEVCKDDDAPEGKIVSWCGIAIARLLDYQDRLEALGELPPGELVEREAANDHGQGAE